MAKNDYQLGSANINQRAGGRGMRAMEKPHDFKGTWIAIFKYCRKYAVWFVVAFSAAIASTLFTLFGPDKLKVITNLITEGMDTGTFRLDEVWKNTVSIAFLYIGSALLIYIQTFTLTTVTQNIMKGMRTDIDKKLNRIPLRRFDSSSFGDLLSRVTNDVDTVGMSMNNALAQMVTAGFTFAGCIVMMFITNFYLTFIAIGCSIIGFVSMRIIITRSQKYFSRRQRYLGLLNGHIEEIYAAHEIIKAYNGEKDALDEFDELNELLYENNWKSQFMSGIMFPIMMLVGNLGYVAVCVFGSVMAKKGIIDFGTIIAFTLYVRMFTQPMGMVAQSATELQSAAAAGERIFSFLAEEEMADESAKTAHLDPGPGRVEFSHVKFGYVPERTIIKDFSTVIEPGQKVAIVGPTGAGKTTIVNLLMRFYELDDGYIAIDGVKTSDITRENVRDMFCMVLQDTWLFEGTIKENIVYSKKNVPDEKVVEACKSVGLHHFISSLPNGYDTVLTSDSNLSAGQRQLMTIARAMIEDAPLLILDEATSSVDTRTEQLVQWAMERLTEGRTSFTIAHRLSTIRNSDVILVMQNGDIVETGSHEELLEKGGFYAQLWNSQFVNAETI